MARDAAVSWHTAGLHCCSPCPLVPLLPISCPAPHSHIHLHLLISYSPPVLVCLLPPSRPGRPTQLLTLACLLVSSEALAAALAAAAAGANSLRLRDIAPGASLDHHLRCLAHLGPHTSGGTSSSGAGYTLVWEGPSEARLVFPSEKVAKAAAEALGGGVRGVFKADRNPTPAPAPTLLPPAASTGGGSGGSSSSAATAAAGAGSAGAAAGKRLTGLAGGAHAAAAAAGGGAGWQTVAHHRSGATSSSAPAAEGGAGGAAAAPDPWADEDITPSAAADGAGGGQALPAGAAAAAAVPDDWEAVLAGPEVSPVRQPLELQQANRWEALADASG